MTYEMEAAFRTRIAMLEKERDEALYENTKTEETRMQEASLPNKLRKTAMVLMHDGAHFEKCFIDGNVRGRGIVVYTQFQLASGLCHALSIALQEMANLIEVTARRERDVDALRLRRL